MNYNPNDKVRFSESYLDCFKPKEARALSLLTGIVLDASGMWVEVKWSDNHTSKVCYIDVVINEA